MTKKYNYREVTFMYAEPVKVSDWGQSAGIYLCQAIGILRELEKENPNIVRTLILDLEQLTDELLECCFIEDPIKDMRRSLEWMERLVTLAEHCYYIPDNIGRECGYMAYLRLQQGIRQLGMNMG